VFGREPSALDAARIGLLPQDFHPTDRLTARELLASYAGLYDDARGVDTVLDDVGLGDDADTRYERLSGGQRRRVCVGLALVNDPDLLVLDEPTTGIDPAGRRSLWSLFEDLAAGGATFLLTSHSMGEIERLADRVGLLADGDLVAVGSPADLVAEYGGESHLRIETTAGRGAVAVALGRSVDRHGGTLRVRGVGIADVGRVVADLEAAGVDVDAFTWTDPDLEEVYLRLTGESRGAGDRSTPSTERAP
jgi:ABC-2 type transport system ATP-binding protein